jgi:hypothetical protein
MARVLCIQPWIYDFAAYNTWIEPLGLLTVAAVLRDVGHEVALIDCLDRHHPDAPAPRSRRDAYGCGQFAKVELPKPAVLAHVPRRWGRYGLPLAVFESELDAQPRPDAILVTSMMTYWYPGPFEAIRRVKARWPDVPVALGGVYATLCAAHACQHSGADAVLATPGTGASGEQKALRWVNAVAGPGTAVALRANVLPAHDLRRPQGYVTIQTARGCPFDCPYCAVHLLAPSGFVPREPEWVLEEIAWCVDSLGARDIAFCDDALLVNAASHIHPILDGVLARGLQVRFHVPNGLHARLLDLPLAHKMRRAGFVAVSMGLESADPHAQQQDGGKVDRSIFARAVEALFQAGFEPGDIAAYVLVGRPGQSVAAAGTTVAFAHRLGVPVHLTQYSPIPGTAEWHKAVQRLATLRPDGLGQAAPSPPDDFHPPGSPANIDPLLHNRSAYPCADAQEWEAFKQRVREANRALLDLRGLSVNLGGLSPSDHL